MPAPMNTRRANRPSFIVPLALHGLDRAVNVRRVLAVNERAAPEPPSAARIWTALLAVYVVWGSTYLAIRVAVQTLPPFLMAGMRHLTAGTVLYAFAIRQGDRSGD